MTDGKTIIPIDDDPLCTIIAHELLMDHARVVQPRTAKDARALHPMRVKERILRHKVTKRNHNDIKGWVFVYNLRNALP